MPTSRRPVESKRRATRQLERSGGHPPKAAAVVVRAARKPAQHFIPGGVLYIYNVIYGKLNGKLDEQTHVLHVKNVDIAQNKM